MNTVYKLFKRSFGCTRVEAKLGFGKTSFVNTAVRVSVCLVTLVLCWFNAGDSIESPRIQCSVSTRSL